MNVAGIGVKTSHINNKVNFGYAQVQELKPETQQGHRTGVVVGSAIALAALGVVGYRSIRAKGAAKEAVENGVKAVKEAVFEENFMKVTHGDHTLGRTTREEF